MNCISYFWLELYFGFFGINFGSFVSKVFGDDGNGSGSSLSSALLNCDGACSCRVLVTVLLCVGCCSSKVDGLEAVVLSPGVCLFLCTFFPGSYFLPLAARWSFFSATAKSLATCSCGYLELKSSFLIRKCAAATKHLVGCLKEMLENFGWNGCGSIKLQQYFSTVFFWVSLIQI